MGESCEGLMSILSAGANILSANNKIISNQDFSPNQILNIRCWMRADLGVTLNGNNVASWLDQSPNAFVASQATPGFQPIYVPSDLNGRPAMRFDGIDDMLTLNTSLLTGTGEFSIFLVATELSNPATSSHLCGNYSFGPNVNGIQCWSGSTNNISMVVGGTNTAGTSALALNNTWIYYWERKGTTVNLRVNDTLDATATNANNIVGNANWSIANYPSLNEPFNGDVYEMIVFNRGLNETERMQVTNYLRQRYGT